MCLNQYTTKVLGKKLVCFWKKHVPMYILGYLNIYNSFLCNFAVHVTDMCERQFLHTKLSTVVCINPLKYLAWF